MAKLPLYQQIIDDLAKKIANGVLKPGEQLPTEIALAEEYNVSRITSKRALTELENQEIIYRLQGKGSFVSEPARATKLISQMKDRHEILLIMPFAENTGMSAYAEGVVSFLRQTHYTINIETHKYANQRELLLTLDHYAGLIIYPMTSTSDLDILYYRQLQQFPMVSIDKQLEGLTINCVTANNFTGGYELTKLLIAAGHRKILYISTQAVDTTTTVRDRYFGYLKALFEHDIQFHSENVKPVADDEAFYHEIVKYAKNYNITAIVAENDLTAMLLMSAAKESGLSLPKDLSIVGFDNIQASTLIEPALTTAAQDFHLMGVKAAEILVNQIEHPKSPIEQVVVDVDIINRQSIALKT
ncbi:GntR family transcriptional regulator [Vagococcus sp. BWB3-3]|uniref:GntR family transcriptional regulator n=1 Tax=Vagococcus allomyrinae TaxID=2794353 RepID=A0A940PFY9_9ENTE|nr:GntR family transcriptional regulator [Vagococcus allomyrinae]MBP1044155.1 GntR family transcriptional regulator [Vagococcus allomyrinae]